MGAVPSAWMDGVGLDAWLERLRSERTMQGRIPAKGGDEQDAFSRWRKRLCGFNRPGRVKRAKKRYWRRARREAKVALRAEGPVVPFV